MRTAPYLVLTVEPSTIGSRSRCTPSRETSGPCGGVAPGNLVDLVDKDDARLLGAMDRFVRDVFHIDQPGGLFLGQELQRLGHFDLPLARSSWA